ncbi:MAG: Extracellular serine protease precursor [Planctomycetes bacterium ADurb.Bin126]|nr:MAG: Extracellular serine protease precursor [Planctomycetes bacterium ADurb.Bin126]HQL72468.1 autotransporter-associated beta strand repeat-containing protein [Phycisphaerae bacterium]
MMSRFLKRRWTLLSLSALVLFGLVATPTQAATTYVWSGATDSDFSLASNWSGGSVPVSGNAPAMANNRITVGGSGVTPVNPLIYGDAQGHTIYNSNDRALFIASGLPGQMSIAGGIFESQATIPDGLSNNAAGSLSIDGGSYVNTNGSGAKTFLMVWGGSSGNGTVTINSGSFAVDTLRWGDTTGSSGTGTVYLNGGTLSVKNFVDGAAATSNVYFNGGDLVALGSSASFMPSNMNNVYVSDGGARINTAGFDVTAAMDLQHDPAGAATDGGLTKLGDGTLTMTADCTYNGGTVISGGTLQIGSGGGTGAPGAGAIVNNSSLVVNRSGSLTIANDISGSGSLTKQGSGTLILSGANSFDGATTVSTGVLNVQSNTALGSTTGQTTVASGARVELQGGVTVTGESVAINGTGGNNFGSLQSANGDNVWAGPVILNGGSDTRVGASEGTLTISGVIQDGATNRIRIRNNNGTTIFSGANTYTGRTDVLVGTLKLDGGDDRLPAGTELHVGVNGTGGLAGTLDLNGWNQTVSGLVCDGLVSSSVTNNGAAPSTFTVNNASGFTYSGKLTSGTGTLNVVKSGAGDLALSGNNSGLTGSVTVSDGRILFASENSGSAQAAWDLGTSECLFNTDVGGTGKTVQLGSLTGVGGSILRNGGNGSGTTTFQVGALGASTTFAGAIRDFDSNTTAALTKVGAGTLTLTGANNYSGATTVSAGVLNIQNSSALGSTAGPTNVAASGLLQLQGGIAVGAEKLNTHRLENVSGNNSWAGDIQAINGVTLALVSIAGKLTITGNVNAQSPDGQAHTFYLDGSGDGEISGLISNPLNINKNGSGQWTLTGGVANYSGLTTIAGGALRVSDASTFGTTGVGTVVNDGARLELAGGITVSGEPLTIAGQGGNYVGALQSVAGDNTWGGLVTLGNNNTRIGAQDGTTLRIGGVIASGANVYDLNVRCADGPTGAVVLSGANAYLGNTNVITGRLVLDGGDNRLPTTARMILGNGAEISTATFDLNGFDQTVNGLLGQGTSMALTVTNSSATASTLAIQSGANLAYRGLISGNLSLVKDGVGTQTLSGNNTYTGDTTVLGGTLALSGAYANNIASSPRIELAAGGVLDVTGLNSGELVLASSQTLAGTGTVVGGLVVGGAVAPGHSPGILNVQDVAFANASTLQIELNGPAVGSEYDRLASGGAVDLGTGWATLDLLLGFDPSYGQTFTIVTAAEGVSGWFAGLEDGTIFRADYQGRDYSFGIQYLDNEVVLQAVPEPLTGLLLLGGLPVLAGRLRRRWQR